MSFFSAICFPICFRIWPYAVFKVLLGSFRSPIFNKRKRFLKLVHAGCHASPKKKLSLSFWLLFLSLKERATGGLKWTRTTRSSLWSRFVVLSHFLALPNSLVLRLASSPTGRARLRTLTLIRRACFLTGYPRPTRKKSLLFSWLLLFSLKKEVTGGLKWTRTTDLTLIRRAL